MISKLIRKAVDNFITKYSQGKRQKILDRVAGIWKDRDDLPDFETSRKDWDRGRRRMTDQTNRFVGALELILTLIC